jgi:hypothetical protein
MPDLRPGNRGIGVSVAVGAQTADGDRNLLRETIRPLEAEDTQTRTQTLLQMGTPLSGWLIRRNNSEGTASGADVYLVEFQSAGRRYRCPLYRFQARTQAIELARVDCVPAREAAAV